MIQRFGPNNHIIQNIHNDSLADTVKLLFLGLLEK